MCARLHYATAVLRGNKDSVMAMLEAFVHDPLINWRLLNTNGPGENGRAHSLSYSHTRVFVFARST